MEDKVKGKVGEKLEEKVADLGGRARNMVPNLTCYELAIRIMMERVEIMREDKTTKDRIGKFTPNSHLGCLICLSFLKHLRLLCVDKDRETEKCLGSGPHVRWRSV